MIVASIELHFFLVFELRGLGVAVCKEWGLLLTQWSGQCDVALLSGLSSARSELTFLCLVCVSSSQLSPWPLFLLFALNFFILHIKKVAVVGQGLVSSKARVTSSLVPFVIFQHFCHHKD